MTTSQLTPSCLWCKPERYKNVTKMMWQIHQQLLEEICQQAESQSWQLLGRWLFIMEKMWSWWNVVVKIDNIVTAVQSLATCFKNQIGRPLSMLLPHQQLQRSFSSGLHERGKDTGVNLPRSSSCSLGIQQALHQCKNIYLRKTTKTEQI